MRAAFVVEDISLGSRNYTASDLKAQLSLFPGCPPAWPDAWLNNFCDVYLCGEMGEGKLAGKRLARYGLWFFPLDSAHQKSFRPCLEARPTAPCGFFCLKFATSIQTFCQKDFTRIRHVGRETTSPRRVWLCQPACREKTKIRQRS